MKTLKDVAVGDTAVIKKINGDGATMRRIMDMGITKKAPVYVRKMAPLGDPIQVSLRGYELTLRKEDAKNIWVED